MALSSLLGGEQVRLQRVTEQVEIDLEALAYLSDAGFIPGADATVTARAPDGTLTLALGAHSFALGPALAQQLYVTARQREPARQAWSSGSRQASSSGLVVGPVVRPGRRAGRAQAVFDHPAGDLLHGAAAPAWPSSGSS